MRKGMRFSTVLWAVLLVSLSAPRMVYGVDFDDPDNFGVKNTWAGWSLNVPGYLGGMLFTDDGETVYVVGNSEQYNSALFAVPLTRDPLTHEVLDMGPADQVTVAFEGNSSVRGLDAGWEIGPEGTLFYTYWDANRLGQRPGGVSGDETLYHMGNVGIPSSVAGLTFSPFITDPNTNFGMMQVSVWQAAGVRDLYNVPLTPLGGGLFEPQQPETFVSLPREGTGAIQYIPSGPQRGNMMYVNWDYGEVWILMIDEATGLPIDDATGLPSLGTDNPRVERFASSLGVGPWGLEFDPPTNDFFVSTWQGSPYNTIIQIGGKGLPPPSVRITTESLPEGLEGEPYSATVEATGGVPPYDWGVTSGSLPDGLSLDPDTGVISGTPTEPGDFTFAVQVMDSDDPADTDEKEFTITVAPIVGGPILAVSTTMVQFADVCLGGDNPPDQGVEVWNAGGGTLYWAATLFGDDLSFPWLTLSPSSGSSTSSVDRTTVTLTANLSRLMAPGEYTATVRVVNTDVPEEMFIDVTVLLRVEVCDEPDLVVAPDEVAFPSVCAGDENPPDQTVEVWNAGTGVLNWSATILPSWNNVIPIPVRNGLDSGWLTVEPSSGVSSGPDEVTQIALAADTQGLADGDYTSVVRFVNDANPEEDYEDVTVTLRVGPATIIVMSNIEADYILRRLADGTEIPGRTSAMQDPKIFQQTHWDVAAGEWEIEWLPQVNAWPIKPVSEVKTLPGCGAIGFSKTYIANMPSDLYQLIIEPIDYATGIYTAYVRIKNTTGDENPPARTFTAPIWLVVKDMVFTVAGPHSEGRLWNADGMTSAECPHSGDYYYLDVSDWAPLESGEISPAVTLEFYIKDRNPNFHPVIEVWADDPVVSPASAFRVERVLCGPSGSILVQWDSEAGATYIVEATESLMGPWTEISNEILCNEGLAQWADAPPEDVRSRFYRVRLLSP